MLPNSISKDASKIITTTYSFISYSYKFPGFDKNGAMFSRTDAYVENT